VLVSQCVTCVDELLCHVLVVAYRTAIVCMYDVARSGHVRVLRCTQALAGWSGSQAACRFFARDGSLLCLLSVLSWSCRIYSVYMFSV
jgi:hypothetical protein